MEYIARIFLSTVGVFICQASVTSEKRNMTMVLDELLVGYDRRFRPGYGGMPLTVKFDISVRSMGPISETEMLFSMDCYFRQLWTDPRLALNVSGINLSLENVSLNIKMLERIWYPDTFFLNGRNSYLHTITVPNKFFRINKDGSILYSQRITIKATCPMYLENFPIDTQHCPLYIGSFAYDGQDVLYRWRFGAKKAVDLIPGLRLSQFDIIDFPAGNKTVYFKGGMHSVLSINFQLRRHMGYFLIQVYVPCCLLVILSWVSFWLNREATADRISLGVTTVLTMTFLALENRTDFPKVSYCTALDVYIAMCFTFVIASIIQFATVHTFTKHGTGENEMTMPFSDTSDEDVNPIEQRKRYQNDNATFSYKDELKKANWLFRLPGCSFRKKSVKKKKITIKLINSVSQIDRISRVLFPVVFTVLNIAYWVSYLG